jgi:hypothetical protein
MVDGKAREKMRDVARLERNKTSNAQEWPFRCDSRPWAYSYDASTSGSGGFALNDDGMRVF